MLQDSLNRGRLFGSTSDVRTILNFAVSPAALQQLLPPDWEQNPERAGPASGTNLRVTFVIPVSGSDPDGNLFPEIRYVIFSVPARKSASNDSNQLMLVAGLTNGGKGPYDTNINATDSIAYKVEYSGKRTVVEESWRFVGDEGSTVSLQMRYARGAVRSRNGEARVFSRVRPEFSRIYRYHEGVDVVRGGDAPHERLEQFAFEAKGSELSRLFDGTERLVSVIALPWYMREIFLPAS